jgi:hypothetical protein
MLFEMDTCVCGHCITNWFAHHPPKVQLNVVHILLPEVEIVGPLNVKGFALVVGVENTGFSVGERVDCNLWVDGQQVIFDSMSSAHRMDRVPDNWLTARSMSHSRFHETQNAE